MLTHQCEHFFFQKHTISNT